MLKNVPQWLSSAVFYQIFPASFNDSNGDGIGDIKGIIQKLDYIKSLGCNAVWLNPCFVSPFGDGGYDVADYYKVAPRYGTNDDLKELFKTAAQKGIKICLDIVPGHTSVEHPWFQRSAEPVRNEYSDRYIWTDSVWDWQDDNFTGGYYSHKSIIGYSQRDGNYFSNYFWFQPALNYGYAKPDPKKKWQMRYDDPRVQAVANDMKDIMRYWLDMGASGFRVDMASSLVKGDIGWKYTGLFWKKVREMFDAEYPDAALIAEWFYPAKAINCGFHIDFMANGKCSEPKAYTSLFRNEKKRSIVFGQGHSFFDKAGKGSITEFMDVYLKHYKATKRRGYISLFSGNHDFPRLSIGRTNKELEIIFAFLLTMPGVPFIYYGDEIGMNHLDLPSKEGGFHRTGARTPMQWDNSQNAGFSDAAADKLYLPVDERKDKINVGSQSAVKNSLLNRVRSLIALRQSRPCLGADGDFEQLYAKKNKYPLVYLRKLKNQKALVVLNPSSQNVNIKFACRVSDAELIAGSGVEIQPAKTAVSISAKGLSYGIFEIN